MDLIIQCAVFVVSMIFLVKSADVFIENAEKLGMSLGLPHFITGVLIVALGTSLPEFSTGIASVLRGETDMLMGNVYGSNVANVFLGIGFMGALLWKNIAFKQNIFQVHFPILVMATGSAILISLDGVVNFGEGLVLLGILMAYLFYLMNKKQSGITELLTRPKFSWSYPIKAAIGLLILIFASKYLIDSVIFLAEFLGFGKTAFAASLVAVGTSLPEMMVVYSAMKRGNAEMIVGNILGSNIFNILLIVGVGALISPLVVSDLTLYKILPFTLVSVFIFWIISKEKEIRKEESLAMVFIYILFLGQLYGWM